MITRLKYFVNSGDKRSIIVKRNILFSFINKGLGIIISLMLVRLTINYVNEVQYGIWLSVSSVITWLSFFDFGITHGLRNRFAEAKAAKNLILAREYVSTSYFAVALLFGALAAVLLVLNQLTNWPTLLNVSRKYAGQLNAVFNVLIITFALQFILNIITTIVTADQRSAFAGFINTTGQVFVLAALGLLTLSSEPSLTKLALVYTIIPCLVYFIFTVWLFLTDYKAYRPTFRFFKLSLIKNIMGLGSKFFLIQLSMIFVFQLTNIITIRILGAEYVTRYNVANKYFGILSMIMIIVITPFWSAFTDAYSQQDYSWMKGIFKKISKLWLFFIPLSVLMLVMSPVVYRLWLGSSVDVPFSLSAWFAVYMLIFTRANLSMYLINGTGKVFIQMLIYVVFAVISVPLMVYFCRKFGLNGILIVAAAQCLIQCIFGEYQIRKIINQCDNHIWGR